MTVFARHITLLVAVGLFAGGLASLHAQSDIKGDVYVLDPSKAYKAQLVATSGMTTDVVISMPTLTGTMLLTGTSGAQGGMAPSTYLFNLQYGSGSGNATGALLTSAVTDANTSATGLEVVATANGTGTATALKLRGNGATSNNYAIEIVEGRIKISSTLPTATSSTQPLVLEGGEVKIGSVGTLTGSGTANKIPVWTGGTALGNSMLSQNGGGTVLTVSGSEIITATSNQLVFGTTNTTTVSATAPAASLTYTMPDVGANADFVLTEGAQTVNGIKTFGSAPNLSSLTARGILGLDASKNITSTTLTNGQILIGSTGATPAAATLTAGSGVTITNGAGTITIAATNPMPAGSVNNSTLRYNLATTSWVENTSVLATSAGALTATRATLEGTTNQLVLGVTNTTTITAPAPAAARTYTIPDAGANVEFVMAAGNQSIGGTKTFTSAVNLSSQTANAILTTDASKNVASTSLTNGQLLIGSTGATPTAATLTAGSGITITNGAGSITIAATNPLPAGTTVDATLRYNGSAWVENTNVLATTGGAITAKSTSNQLILGTTNTTTINATAPATSAVYTIPDVGATASFVMNAGAQTIAGVKTFSSAPNLSSLTASLPLKLDGAKNITAAAIDLTSSTEITGALPVNRGGTNSAVALNSNRIMVSSSGAIVEAAALTNGQLLIGSLGAAPVAANLTAGSGITITNGAGSITIAATNPMPAGTTTDATLRYSGTAWVENTNVRSASGGALTLAATTNQLILGAVAGPNVTITSPAPAASRIYTIPDAGAAASFVMTEGAQTINGVKTFGSAPNLSSLTASLPLKLDGSKNVTAAAIDLTSATEVTGALPINRGGTNSATALNSNRIMVSSGGAIVEAAALTNGQLLVGSTGASPVAATLTAGSGITITNGAGTISIASSGWSLTGNAGLTDNTNNYLGTTDAQPIYFITGTGGPNKRMTIGATGLIGMNTTPLASYTLAIQGNVKMVDATTSTISANKELVLEQTGDVYGTSRLRLQHRNGSNGALFDTQGGTVDLVDFGFKPGAGVQSNIRLEARTASLINSTANTTGEFQFLMASTTTPVYALTLGQGSATFNAGVVGIGDPTPDDKFTVGTTSQFRVSSTGDITRIRDIAYTWPAAHATGVFTNNGSGTLSWTPGTVVPSGTATDQTLRWSGSAWVANSTVTASSAGVISSTATTNQLVLGTTRTVTINATQPASASLVYTIPDAGAAASFVMTEGTQTINGAKTLTGSTVIGSTAAATVTLANSTGSLTVNGTALTPNVTMTSLGGTARVTVPIGYDRIVLANSAGSLDEASITAVLGTTLWSLTGNSTTSAWNGTTGSFLGSTSAQALVLATTNATAQDIRFFTGAGGANERVRINSTGEVGIGTTSASGQLLTVNGTAGTPNVTLVELGGTAKASTPVGYDRVVVSNTTGSLDEVALSTIVQTSGAQTIAGAKAFSSAIAVTPTTNQLVLGTGTTVTINSPATAANRIYSLPVLTADASFVMTEGAQTINGNKTISGTTNLSALTASLPLKLDASKNITAAAIDLSSATEVVNALPANRGGTSFSTYATGDILYASAANTLSKLTIGAPGNYLTVVGSVPQWSSGAIMQYDIAAAQTTSTTPANWLFNVGYGTANGATAGARIASVSTGSNTGSTGLTIVATATGTATATALSLSSSSGTGAKYALTVADGSGYSGFGTTAPTHVVHALNTATTDELSAVYGNASGAASATNQAVGVWGDASNNAATNTGSIGVLATGSGRTTTAETNIALQLNDGEFTVGRTTETGTGYTVVEGATAGVSYTAEGPSGVIEVNLGTVGNWQDNATPSTDRFKKTTFTLTNRYINTSSIVLFTVIDMVNSGSTTPNPEEGIYIVNGDGRAAGSIVVHLGVTITNGGNTGSAWQNGDKVRIGYMIVNPSK